MRCTFCSRQSVNGFPEKNLFFCESCGKAYREGFEHGRVFQSIDRRQRGRMIEVKR